MTTVFNPFIHIKERPVVIKSVPVDLKPFVPKLKNEQLHAGGYITDLDFFDGNLIMVYSTGTKILYRGMTEKAVDSILRMEVDRFYVGF